MRKREAQADEVEMSECAEPSSGRVGDFEESEGGKSVQPTPLIRDKRPEAERLSIRRSIPYLGRVAEILEI
jgi:hypothetical protein